MEKGSWKKTEATIQRWKKQIQEKKKELEKEIEVLSPSSNCKLVSFVLGKAFWGRRGKNLNEEPEFGNRILDDAHKLWNALQNIDLTGRFSVGQAMIETAYKKTKSANTDMVLCLKKKC